MSSQHLSNLPPPIVLASSSPNRKALLSRLGLPFQSISPDIDESPQPEEPPIAMAQRLATEKGEKVLNQLHAISHDKNATIIIASDQVAFSEKRIFNKPESRQCAIDQLLEMQNKPATFYTALDVMLTNATGIHKRLSGGTSTHVTFRALTSDQIAYYVDTDQPLQCAGAAKCESLGIALLSRVESDDPTAIIGLPLILLTDFLLALGINILSFQPTIKVDNP